MASEILGLFGGKNPQQLQQDYLSGLMVSPAQMGSQGLLQQLISTGANAGAMMGYGGGRLLGGKVAGEVEASYIDEAVKAGSAVKGTPAEKMQAVADALADKPGMGKQYIMAQQEARRLQAEDLQMQKARQDLTPPYKDFMVETVKYVDNGQGQIVPVKDYIRVTRKYNPVTKEYEDMKQSSTQPTGGTTGSAGGMPGWDKDAIAAQIAKNEEAAAKAKAGQTPPPSIEDQKNLATVDPAKYAEELRRQEAAAGEAARAELNKPKDYSNEGRNNQRMVFSSEIDKQRAAARAWSEGRMKDFQIISQAVVIPRK